VTQGAALVAAGAALLTTEGAVLVDALFADHGAATGGMRLGAVALAASGAWLVYLGLGLASPALAAAFHARVSSRERATMLSLRSLAAYAGGVGATLALGGVAEGSGLHAVWFVVAGLALGAALAATLWRAGDARTALPEQPLPAEGR